MTAAHKVRNSLRDAVLSLTGRRRRGIHPDDPALAEAWTAWAAGDVERARRLAAGLIDCERTADAGHAMAALVAHVTGDHRGAIAHAATISHGYRWPATLAEAVLWSHVHSDDHEGAIAFVRESGFAHGGTAARRLSLWAERPPAVTINGVAELPFIDDALTPWMPGIDGRLGGKPVVARLDTGGSFLHLSADLAAAHGIAEIASERAFGALSWHQVGYGVAAEFELGPVRFVNLPVAIHHGGVMPAAFGVELGPIFGTNVLRPFLSTIDGPHARILLSDRRDPHARAAHLALVGDASAELPFLAWGDHCMIVRGSLGDRPDTDRTDADRPDADRMDINLFVDTGLVAGSSADGQAAVLASHEFLARRGAQPTATPPIVRLPGPISIGPASLTAATAVEVSSATWRGFGNWGGIDVQALVSWGFFKHVAVTIDFDRYRYLVETRFGA